MLKKSFNVILKVCFLRIPLNKAPLIDDKEKDKQLYHLSRVFILDIYRTHACLIYPATVIAIAGVILAASLLKYQLP